MKIVYVRQDSGVSIDGYGFAKPGEPIEVPDEIGEALIKGGLFEKVDESKIKKRR